MLGNFTKLREKRSFILGDGKFFSRGSREIAEYKQKY